MFLIVITLLTALAISATAAWFSVFGLAHLFAAASGVWLMATVVEVGKIVGTSWLYQTWDTSTKLLKGILMALVFGAMIVTSLGVYGYLSKGYLDVQAPIEQKQLELTVVNEELANVKDRILFIDEEVSNYRNELKDLQAQIDNYPKNYATERRKTYREQSPRRKEVNETIGKLRKEKVDELHLIKKINAEKALINKGVIEVEGDIGPIKYVAATMGIPQEQAVRALILLLIVIFDPLAITLILAANVSISNKIGKKGAGIGDLFEASNAPEPEYVFDEPVKSTTKKHNGLPEETVEYINALNNTITNINIDKDIL